MKEYNIEVTVDQIRPGPVVTQYGLIPGWIRKYKDEFLMIFSKSVPIDVGSWVGTFWSIQLVNVEI